MNSRFMTGVGIVALAGALGASPAFASESEDASEFRLEANSESDGPTTTGTLSAPMPQVSTFDGLEAMPFNADFSSIDLNLARTSAGFVGNITQPDSRLLVRDDVGVDFGDPDDTQPSAVHMFQQVNASGGVFFNCTGTVINPRTILTAAHCLNASDQETGLATRSSEAYGLPGSGAERTVLMATGQSSADRLFNYIDFGSNYDEGGVASSTDVIIHPTGNPDNVGLGFPWADVALIAVDTPITDVPAMPILLTPLTELTHVVQVGYGTNGVGSGTAPAGSSFLRRVGENMLGMVGSLGDFIDPVFSDFAPSTQVLGFESQAYYWTDFDNPDRTEEQVNGCEYPGDTISCQDLDAVLAIDFFDGDALPFESGTGPGDSGSALIVDELYGTPAVTAVLSGGFDFFGLGGVYSDVSFYNPLYPFFEFLTENTPYKYVSAAEGDGVWSDPTHWTQDLDPGFLIDDGTGTLVNGIPEGNEPGIYETGPKLGLVLGTDISGNNDQVTPGFEGIDISVPESSVLLGPGSTGFVPMNTDGTPGTAFANPAQYFEVHLNRAGTTTVDMDVEIDKLIIENFDAGFVLPEAFEFTSIIETLQLEGSADIDGVLNTSTYVLGLGELTGEGTINTNAFFNISGAVSPAGQGEFGELTINGDFVQASAGGTLIDFEIGRRRSVENDLVSVSGLAVLDGALVVATESRRARFGTEFTVLNAGEIDGTFSDVVLLSRSPILAAEARVEGGEVVVELTARSIRDLLGRRSDMRSLGRSLDNLRGSRFNEFVGLFDIVDNATVDTLGATLAGLTPTSAFQQTFTANSFSQRFTGQIAQRTLSLRGGSRAAGGFTAAGNASYAINGTTPDEAGKIGVFGSASGVYLNGGQPIEFGNAVSGPLADGFANGVVLGNGSANALEQAALTPAGELTIGADMQVTDGFSFGVAMSRIRSSDLADGALRPQEDTSESMAVYMTYADGGMFADGYAGTADQQFGVQRAAQGDLSSLYRNAIGQSDGTQTFGGLRLGYAFDLAKGVEVGPVASLDYLRSDIDGYSEVGMGDLGLTVAGRSFTSLGAKAGAMASLDVMTSGQTTIRAFGSVAYARELADTADVVTAHFAGAPEAAFTISNQLDPSWMSVNAGAEMQVGANLTASVSVTSDMGRGLLSNDQGQVSLSWRF